jgi:arylsulfatase B
MHVSDLLPTFASVANITMNDKSLDGVDQWETISLGLPSTRKEVLYNIENIFGYSAVMHEGYKLVNGTENIENANWFGSTGFQYVNVSFEDYFQNIFESEASQSLPQLDLETVKNLRNEATVKCSESHNFTACDPLKAPCLFNIVEDPCEQNNLADLMPGKMNFMLSRLEIHIQETLPSRRIRADPNCDPINFNRTWNWWQDDEVSTKNYFKSRESIIYVICSLVLVMLTCLLLTKLCKQKGSLIL